ncbi:MAG TPA: hypothetical protein VG753_00330 [Candidatus Paceibacterota bacterium]|nr:hypothetical protein [Candidatus Paceibacterota bacterium]
MLKDEDLITFVLAPIAVPLGAVMLLAILLVLLIMGAPIWIVFAIWLAFSPRLRREWKGYLRQTFA